jgi:hypothetical protein
MIMYPTWLTNLFINNTCPECHEVLTVDDIVAIGARRPEQFEAHLREAMTMILVRCHHCRVMINFSTRCLRAGLVDAVHELCDRIESADITASPLFGSDAQQPSSDPTDCAPVRPSIRRDHPDTPPTQAEVRAFLDRLRRASFKRGSKGFRNWMKGFRDDQREDNS